MRKFQKSIFIFVGAIVFGMAMFGWVAQAAGLVPCGGQNEGQCTLCHIIIGGENIIKWGLNVMTYLALAVITAMGILYIVSAGDKGMMGTAKKGIQASLVGFVFMLTAWLIVNFIMATLADNFGLAVKKDGALWYSFSCDKSQNFAGGIYNDNTTYIPSAGGVGKGGSCNAINEASNACSVQNMPKSCFGGRATEASKICNFESQGGNVAAVSGTDRCVDGTSFSHGLWQINLVTGGNMLPSECRGLFTGGMDCAPNGYVTNSKGVKYCARRNCRFVGSQEQMNSCLKAIRNPVANTQVACKLYDAQGHNFSPWPHTASSCLGHN